MADTSSVMQVPSAIYLNLKAREVITGRVLDAGCGHKPYKQMFPECEWVGLDKRPVGEITADLHELVEMTDLHGTFNTVICTEVLHQCISPFTVMQGIAACLKPGGHLVVTAPNCYAEDEESLWGIKVRGMDYLVAQAGLKGVDLRTEGRVWSQEWFDFNQFNKFGQPVGENHHGWLTQCDARYPVVTIAVARKE